MFSFLPLLLGGLSYSIQCATADEVYYVTPDTVECSEGPMPCHDINCYINNVTSFFSIDKDNITMTFLSGTHAVAVENDFEVFGLNRLTMVGLTPYVVIKTTASIIPTWSFRANELHVKNFTMLDLILSFQVSTLSISSVIFQGSTEIGIEPPSESVDAVLSPSVDTKLTRCEFKERSFIKVTEISNLTLLDCEFLNVSAVSSDSPLSLYHSMVYLSGATNFIGNYHSAISAFYSEITMSGIVQFMYNIGKNGGALALYSSTLNFDNTASIFFTNNKATNLGGAIFVNTGTIFTPVASTFSHIPCFFQILQPSKPITFQVSFTQNYAMSGGYDIYGASIDSHCQISKNSTLDDDVLEHFHFNTKSLSSVSGSPSRVCVCENETQPQCTNVSSIYITRFAYPGEVISLPVAIVGGDYGTTQGTVYIGFVNRHGSIDYRDSQVLSTINTCTYITLRFCSQANTSNISVYLSSVPFYDNSDLQYYYTRRHILRDSEALKQEKRLSFFLHTTPVFIDVTFLDCPPLLYLGTFSNGYYYSYRSYYGRYSNVTCLDRYDYSCNCHPQFQFNCYAEIYDRNVDIRINSGWTGFENETDTVLFARQCLFDYCISNFGYFSSSFDSRNASNFDNQCASNRRGTLCGGCREGYSLALGSSRCLKCSSNDGLALVILFAAAGPFLVFLISILNLTVTQGMINGLVLYSIIVWNIRNIVTRSLVAYNYPAIILAWLNLDFGIEVCFFNGLDAYAKTWLQFLFPFFTAGLFFVGLKFSSKLSKLFGDRSVPTLATLLFLSYTKLQRTITAALGFVRINKLLSVNDFSNLTLTVWSLDGNVIYGEWKHILLILAALACLILLWIPYLFLLLSIPRIRRISNSRLSRWITRYKPVFDAYYAPLNDKHNYWFGLLLGTMGTILTLLATLPSFSRILWYCILIIATLLLFHMNLWQVYRKKSVQVTESLFLMNIILLMVGILNDLGYEMYIISLFLAYVELTGIIIWNIFWSLYPKCKKQKKTKKPSAKSENNTVSSESVTTTSYVDFRDSILMDSI